jgi:hypothetical protein
VPTTWMPTVLLRGPSSSTSITDCESEQQQQM